MPLVPAACAAAIKATVQTAMGTYFPPDANNPTFSAAQQEAFANAVSEGIANGLIPYLLTNTIVVGTCPSGGGPLSGGLLT